MEHAAVACSRAGSSQAKLRKNKSVSSLTGPGREMGYSRVSLTLGLARPSARIYRDVDGVSGLALLVLFSSSSSAAAAATR